MTIRCEIVGGGGGSSLPRLDRRHYTLCNICSWTEIVLALLEVKERCESPPGFAQVIFSLADFASVCDSDQRSYMSLLAASYGGPYANPSSEYRRPLVTWITDPTCPSSTASCAGPYARPCRSTAGRSWHRSKTLHVFLLNRFLGRSRRYASSEYRRPLPSRLCCS